MSNTEKLLIVEDDPEISRQLKWALAEEYEVTWRRMQNLP